MARQSDYTVLIVCEGENTEPHFFNAIRDRILQKRYPVGEIVITIHPEPIESKKKKDKEQEEKQNEPKEYVRERKSRSVLLGKPLPKEIPGVPPLKWVLAAQDQLKEGTYNEAWVVFDKDKHPSIKEAFDAAANDINGTKVQIAYSSIAFEYYLLLHFERYYFPFHKSECRVGNKALNCSTTIADEGECNGTRCIGGYARKMGYWQDSKERNSLFPLIEPLLEKGFWNAAWIRHESQLQDTESPLHERNPYLTTDSIVKRLTGRTEHLYEFVQLGQEFIVPGRLVIVFDNDFLLKITNVSNIGIVLPKDSITVTTLNTGQQHTIGERRVIKVEEQVSLPFANSREELLNATFTFTIDIFHIGLNFRID